MFHHFDISHTLELEGFQNSDQKQDTLERKYGYLDFHSKLDQLNIWQHKDVINGPQIILVNILEHISLQCYIHSNFMGMFKHIFWLFNLSISLLNSEEHTFVSDCLHRSQVWMDMYKRKAKQSYQNKSFSQLDKE